MCLYIQNWFMICDTRSRVSEPILTYTAGYATTNDATTKERYNEEFYQ